MTDIPTGNITFLFTDIEGSTKLSQDFPEKLHFALERHNQILKEVLESNNGFIYDMIGDSFFCAFENAVDAVKAAVAIQTELGKENWEEVEIKVRIGIHSGNAEWNGERYMGYITLARTARIMDAAYGEQILISNNTHLLCLEGSKTQRRNEKDSESLSLGDFEAKFRDLGERRLKDVIEPIRLFQIESDGLRAEFPPLKTLDARPNNLPIQLTSFIGREKEMKYIKEELKRHRLLSLIGAGGAGKTRFALQTAAEVIDEFENGVWFVDLSALKDIALLSSTMNNALGIKEESKKTSDETLIDYLKEKEILIILDNCEQLINACALLTERLLSSCPRLKMISTSREAMNCGGEFTFRIPPLTQPDPNQNNTPEELTQYESVRLFIERALSVKPKFRVTNENAPALAEVCSRLDGIPLAIELAAARIKVLSLEKIYERLDDRFNLLTGGKRTALPRQQTLRALIDWSYDLLSEEEKILWSRLSVFNGGWTLEAAEEICTDDKISGDELLDLLGSLAEKSIIIYDDEKDRYKILETIKQYGEEKLKGFNENGKILSKHLHYFMEFSKKAEPELRSEKAKFLLGKIEADRSNFISAIDWSVNNENTEKGGLIAAALGEYLSSAGHYSTGIRLIKNILQSSDKLTKSLEGKLLYWIGVFKWSQGDYDQAKKYSEVSLSISKEIGDKTGIVAAMNSLGSIAYYQGDYEQDKKYSEEGLAISKEIGYKKGISISMNSMGNIAYYQGDYEEAKNYYKESLAFSKEFGDNKVIAVSLNNLAYIENYQGNYAQAMKYSEESLVYGKEIGDKNVISVSMTNLGITTSKQGDYEVAFKYLKESLAIRKEIGDKRGIAISLNCLGNVSFSQKDYEQAAIFYKESLAIYKVIGDKNGIAECLSNLGKVFLNQGDYFLTVKLLSASEKIMESIGSEFDSDDQVRVNEIIENLKDQLNDEEFIKHWKEGENLTLEEAWQLAVSS